jgi:guanosine-3',5'-bis(diphosphate) 3'-pyrophosphohydrolase
MATLESAIQLAAEAHSGQQDKAGKPYILHPIRVMLSVSTTDEQIAAILHDTVEDTSVTFEQLSEAGFSAEIISAVRALTKLDGESRVDAARRAAKHPIARQVKLADVKDNLDISRIPHLTDKDHARLDEYKLVQEILMTC